MNTASLTTRRLVFTLGSVALATTLTGCGGGSDDTSATLPTASTMLDDSADNGDGGEQANPDEKASTNPDEAMLAFDRCLAERGVDVQSQNESGDGGVIGGESSADDADDVSDADSDATMKAFEECDKHLQGAFSEDEADPAFDAELADLNAAYQRCMVDAGFDVEADENGMYTYNAASDDDRAAYDEADRKCWEQ